ncbi:STAS domain-containing protein [Ferrimonas gelatinilytica]|uniref:STAS domain-containing protein n=1 Tax=Ferrimonas gelatinilytica TaxID=1255257 RepID=A0ABP9SDY9_9GAMM
MSLSVAREGETLALSGQLNQTSVMAHWPIPESWLSCQRLSLAQVEEVDSAGLAFLIELTRLSEAGRALAWQHCPKPLAKLMALYDLQLEDERLNSHTDIEE